MSVLFQMIMTRFCHIGRTRAEKTSATRTILGALIFLGELGGEVLLAKMIRCPREGEEI